MKMRKIIAIVAAVLMLFSIIPFSAMAAGEETITVTAATGALASDSLSISWDGTNYQVVNYKDNSTTAIRTSDTTHFRAYVGNEFYVQGKDGALMSQVVINCTGSSYLINNSSNTVDAGWTVSANGTTITYTAAEPAAELHISIGKQSRVTSVVITPATTGGTDCDHNALECGEVCPDCGEYTKEHVFANNCAATCSNCNEANPNYADHVYDGDYDVACNVCTATRDVNFPAADSTLTITEANTIGEGMSHDTTTSNKYYVTGVVESIANTTYGNLYIQDDEGNKLYIYGMYDGNGNRFDAMAEKPEVDMIITVYGVIGNYSNAAQMKNVDLISMDNGCEHEYSCTTVDPTCTEDGSATYVCALCGKTYTETLPANGHDYVDDVCTVCGTVKPAGYAPITSADQLVSGQYVMVVETGYAPTYFESGWVLTGQPAITNDVISADDAAGYLWTLTVDGNSVTITDANGASIAPKGGNTNGISSSEYAWAWTFEDGQFIFAGTGEDTVYFASNTTANSGDNKFRAYKTATVSGNTTNYKHKFTLYAASNSTQPDEPECTHQWSEATCTEPATCALCGAKDGAALGHSYGEAIETKAPDCTTAGEKQSTCTVCGDVKTETINALGHNFVDGTCSACGAELSQKVDKIDDVANLTAGTYYLAGYATGYVNGTTVEDWSSYPWHVWTGDVYSGDLETTPYYYSENNGGFGIASTDPTVSGTLIELQAVEGKADTYYIVCNAKYLASTENATSRRLALVTEPTEAVPVEWVATANANGGITLSSNGVYLGTGDAASRLVRAYKAESTLKYGVVLFAFDNDASDCEHEYTSVETEPTCGAAGVITYTCSLCGHSYTEEGAPATGVHTADGYACSVCGAILYPDADTLLTIDQANALGVVHNSNVFSENKYYVAGTITEVYNTTYGNMKITDEAGNILTIYGTYNADGTIRYDALETKPVVGDFVKLYGIIGQYNGTAQMKNGWIITHEPHTCDSNSNYPCVAGVCTICGATIPATVNHQYESRVVQAPSCVEPGLTEYTCSVCGDSYEEEIAAEGHTYSEAACDTTCNICGEERAVPVGHTYTYPCDRICSVCYELTNPNATHTIVAVEAVEATCSQNGNIAYWYCSDCGYVWADEALTQQTNRMNIVIPATGEHTYDDEYDAVCNECGETRDVPEKPVEDILYGDVNSDGGIDSLDAILLQQYLAGWEVELDFADVNGDGGVDSLDAILLQQYLAGWEVELGPKKVFNDGEFGAW